MSADRGLIAFDATPLEVKRRAGVSHYVAELLGGLVARRDGRRYALLASRRIRGRVPDGTLGQVGARFPNRWLWMQFVLPAVVARLQPALCHFTNSVAPIVGTRPYVLTLYDLSLFRYARTQPFKSRVLVGSLMPAAARRAAAILALSSSARAEISEQFGVPLDRVHVVGAAASSVFRPMDDADADRLDDVRRRWHLDEPFVLAVGTIEPRKNLSRLVDAIGQIRRRGRAVRLVIAGQLGWGYRKFLARLERHDIGDAVRLLHYVPDEDLPALYNLARVVAFPSLYEGFGLPIIEAMACGTPVLSSNRPAMAETAGGAGLLVDPTSVETIADGLEALLGDEALRARCRQAGVGRAAEFSWARVAERTAAVYDQVARATSGL